MEHKNPKSLRDRAETTKQKILEVLNVSDHDHDEELVRAIEKTIIEALLAERERCAVVAFKHCCDEDRDQAHKIADDIKRVRTALVTNLESMR